MKNVSLSVRRLSAERHASKFVFVTVIVIVAFNIIIKETMLPLYTQIASEFADLDDTSGRMEAEGVIHKSLVWRQAHGDDDYEG